MVLSTVGLKIHLSQSYNNNSIQRSETSYNTKKKSFVSFDDPKIVSHTCVLKRQKIRINSLSFENVFRQNWGLKVSKLKRSKSSFRQLDRKLDAVGQYYESQLENLDLEIDLLSTVAISNIIKKVLTKTYENAV